MVTGNCNVITGREPRTLAPPPLDGIWAKENGVRIWGSVPILPPVNPRVVNCGEVCNICNLVKFCVSPVNWGCKTTPPVGNAVCIYVIGDDNNVCQLVWSPVIICVIGSVTLVVESPVAVGLTSLANVSLEDESEVDGLSVTAVIDGTTSGWFCCVGDVAVCDWLCFSFFRHLALLFWNQTYDIIITKELNIKD